MVPHEMKGSPSKTYTLFIDIPKTEYLPLNTHFQVFRTKSSKKRRDSTGNKGVYIPVKPIVF